MRRRHGARWAALALFAGLGCADHHSSTQTEDAKHAPRDDGTGGHASVTSSATGGVTSGSGGATSGSGGATSGTGGAAAVPVGNREHGCCGPDRTDVAKLDCACTPGLCEAQPYDQRLKAALDCHPTYDHDPLWSPIHHGCGLVSISIGNGIVGSTWVYRESDHELVGGGSFSDDGTGCQTENTDLSHCPDYSTCSPCSYGPATSVGTAAYDLCPESDAADADGGS
jgi:hypothetical protein